MQIHIVFNPASDSAASIADMVARIYGSAPGASVNIHPDDNPGAGEEAGSAVSTVTATGAKVLDKDGLPWDDRIHSTPAKQTGKEIWRKRKGVDALTVSKVEAELRAALSAAATPAGLPPPPANAAAPAPAGLPGLPTPPGAASLPPPPVAPQPTPYESFVAWIGDHVSKGTNGVTAEWVAAALTNYGVEGGLLVNLQGAAPDFIASLRTAIAGVLQVPAI